VIKLDLIIPKDIQRICSDVESVAQEIRNCHVRADKKVTWKLVSSIDHLDIDQRGDIRSRWLLLGVVERQDEATQEDHDYTTRGQTCGHQVDGDTGQDFSSLILRERAGARVGSTSSTVVGSASGAGRLRRLLGDLLRRRVDWRRGDNNWRHENRWGALVAGHAVTILTNGLLAIIILVIIVEAAVPVAVHAVASGLVAARDSALVVIVISTDFLDVLAVAIFALVERAEETIIAPFLVVHATLHRIAGTNQASTLAVVARLAGLAALPRTIDIHTFSGGADIILVLRADVSGEDAAPILAHIICASVKVIADIRSVLARAIHTLGSLTRVTGLTSDSIPGLAFAGVCITIALRALVIHRAVPRDTLAAAANTHILDGARVAIVTWHVGLRGGKELAIAIHTLALNAWVVSLA